MKSIIFLFLVLFSTLSSYAQRPVEMRNLWTRAQVHVLFEGYTVSFAIKDINRSLAIMREMGDSSQPATCGLDTAKDYYYDLFPGIHAEFHHEMQPLLQNVVGAFLLTAGHAIVQDRRHKTLKSVIMDIGIAGIGEHVVSIYFYDPKNKKILFEGRMDVDMYKKDLGIDD